MLYYIYTLQFKCAVNLDVVSYHNSNLDLALAPLLVSEYPILHVSVLLDTENATSTSCSVLGYFGRW